MSIAIQLGIQYTELEQHMKVMTGKDEHYTLTGIKSGSSNFYKLQTAPGHPNGLLSK